MFLLAWSFALNAVEYVRRKRITRLILSFIEESAFLDGQASLICRTIRERQHSSEPPSVVNRTQWRMNFLNGVETERCIYETDEIQIVIKPEKIILQEDAWNWRPSYWNFDIKYHKDRVSFLVRLAVYTRQKKHGQIYTQLDEPSTADDEVSNTIGTEDNKSEENNANEFICHSDEELSSEFMDYLEDNAHLIAQHKNFRHLLYYESTLRDFYEIVFLWTEGKLFSNGTPIDEIYTVDVPFSHNFYGRSTSQSRQLSNLSENESSDSALNISKSHELSSSHLSLASSYNFPEYNLPKYCGGWRFSREKIARYHQFALQRRLSSLVAGNHSETSRFLNQFLKMSLRAKDRLSASAICLNYRSSSSYPLPCSSAIADANIRTSAMNIFATDIKQRSQSFPRRNFFSNAVRNHEINGVGSDHCNNNNYDGDLLQRFNVNGSQKATKKFAKPSSKPPSILVYTGDQKELFSEIAASLVSILPRDVYVVRDLTTRALKYHPWSHEHCVCLIVASTQQLDDQAWSQLQHYFNNSGKMLFVCQNALLAGLTSCGSMKKQVNLLKSVFERKTCGGIFGKDFESFLKKSFRQLAKSQKINEIFHTKDAGGGYQFAVVLCKNIGQPFLLYMQTSENHKVRSCALFSDVTTDELLRNGELVADVLSRLGVDVSDHETAVVDGARTEANTPRLSFGYLFCQSDRLIHEIKGLTYGKTFNATLALTFQHFSNTLRNDDQPLPEPSADCLPIFVCRRAEKLEELKHCFDHIAYFDVLKTKRLGRTLLYVPTCTTTIDIAKSFSTVFPESDGILIASSYQIRGRGRSGNVWLSPMGCATFQFNFNIPSDTELGRSITFLQHIASVAIVDAILTQLGDKNFPIKIKWPNDIYYKRDFKLGGILVIASQQGAQFECSIGAGINVANSKPTVCINDFLTNGKALVIEEFLAEVMNKFEYYLNVFVHQGKAEFTKKYISYWMHNGEEVTIIHEEDNSRERVTIRSLDENGFLSVQSKETARMFSVQDDGNSFDIMHGLIHFKR